MKSFFGLFVDIFLKYYEPIRFKLRESAMKKLSSEFTLEFNSSLPDFYELIKMGLKSKSEWEINNIKGTINNHKIYIFDHIRTSNFKHTVINIDGEYLKGKEKEFKPFKMGDAFLTSIWELKRLLKSL